MEERGREERGTPRVGSHPSMLEILKNREVVGVCSV